MKEFSPRYWVGDVTRFVALLAVARSTQVPPRPMHPAPAQKPPASPAWQAQVPLAIAGKPVFAPPEPIADGAGNQTAVTGTPGRVVLVDPVCGPIRALPLLNPEPLPPSRTAICRWKKSIEVKTRFAAGPGSLQSTSLDALERQVKSAFDSLSPPIRDLFIDNLASHREVRRLVQQFLQRVNDDCRMLRQYRPEATAAQIQQVMAGPIAEEVPGLLVGHATYANYYNDWILCNRLDELISVPLTRRFFQSQHESAYTPHSARLPYHAAYDGTLVFTGSEALNNALRFAPRGKLQYSIGSVWTDPRTWFSRRGWSVTFGDDVHRHYSKAAMVEQAGRCLPILMGERDYVLGDDQTALPNRFATCAANEELKARLINRQVNDSPYPDAGLICEQFV